MLLAPAFAALVINVSSTADVSPTLLDRVIAEANAIWHPADVTLVWNRTASTDAALTIVVGDRRGDLRAGESSEPLGWISFANGRPLPEVYVSYTNAVDLLQHSIGAVGRASAMPPLELETYLGRAMGRALAHEVGHYLFASPAHSPRGLMKAARSAWDFFDTTPVRFALSPAERAQAVARLQRPPLLATSDSAYPMCRPPASPPPAALPSPRSTRC